MSIFSLSGLRIVSRKGAYFCGVFNETVIYLGYTIASNLKILDYYKS